MKKLFIITLVFLLTACTPNNEMSFTETDLETNLSVSQADTSKQVSQTETTLVENELTSIQNYETSPEPPDFPYELIKKSNCSEAYLKILNEYMSSEDYVYTLSAFDLYDIDGDEVPELFISEGGYHSSGVWIYTYSNGNTICLNPPEDEYGLGSWGQVQLCGNTIRSSYSSNGNSNTVYFHKEDNTLVKELEVSYSFFEGKNLYTVNGTNASENEYFEAISSYTIEKDVGLGTLLNNESIEFVF